MEPFAFALIAVAFIAAGFFVWYFTFQAKQEERRLFIEKGYKPEELPATPGFTFPWRKTGIVLVGGVLGMLLHEMTFNIQDGTLPALLLGSGIGMILANAFENGYPVRRFWRTLVYGFLGFAGGGVILSVAYLYMPDIPEELSIFTMLVTTFLAFFIEIRTRKADQSGA